MAFNIFKKEENKTAVPEEKAGEKKLPRKHVFVKDARVKKTQAAWRILRTAHITEKATDLSGKDQYIFNVYKSANKNEVKKAVESIYGVDVVCVNMINIPPKTRRVGKNFGKKPGYRKAIVSIKEGQKIELMPR